LSDSCAIIDPVWAAEKMARGEMIPRSEMSMRVNVGCLSLALHFVTNYWNRDSDDHRRMSIVGLMLGATGVMLYRMGKDSQ